MRMVEEYAMSDAYVITAQGDRYPLACAREECDHESCCGRRANFTPLAPQMLCETCWDVLTSDVLPADCTLTGLEEACCPRCWPFMTQRADGSMSREAWDKAVAKARDERDTRE